MTHATIPPAGQSHKNPLRKLTVLLEPELAQTIMSERARIAATEGVNVSLTALATRAMRAGFAVEAERKR